ncbi:MAG TPA: hypothetical protein DCX25_04035 [Candidatus Pacebacteria bacterium]|nr:hypothetical protein [Candidatus Paceibacterota bacterium]HCR11283.1 hypothetical protein [Candidatus Paceibacterota bacterium]HCR92553.1 hypothetical protein [Candidatus Paceibacterota bacterium]
MPSSLFEQPIIAQPAQVVQQAQSAHQLPVSIAGATHVKTAAHFSLKLIALYTALFFTPIAGAFALNTYSSSFKAPTLLSPVSQQAQDTSVADITQASTNSLADAQNTQSNDLNYELSLANGFLQKAVDLSNATTDQTPQDKETIVGYLNQALEAANRAMSLAPDDARGYSSRGRVYQAISAIKPEVKPLADSDFAKAQQLGAQNPTSAPETQNPTEYLPTQQASENYALNSIIAGPQEQLSTTVTGQSDANAQKGHVALEAGKTDVVVSYPQVKDTTQLYVTTDKNPDGVTLYVKNKEAGTGFTIGATAPPSAPLDITWWEIQ